MSYFFVVISIIFCMLNLTLIHRVMLAGSTKVIKLLYLNVEASYLFSTFITAKAFRTTSKMNTNSWSQNLIWKIVILFNFRIGCDQPGKYKIMLDSDDPEFGGLSRLDRNTDFFTKPEGFANRRNSMFVSYHLPMKHS